MLESTSAIALSLFASLLLACGDGAGLRTETTQAEADATRPDTTSEVSQEVSDVSETSDTRDTAGEVEVDVADGFEVEVAEPEPR